MLNDILDIELNKSVKINFTCVSLFSYQTTGGGGINSHEWLSQVPPSPASAWAAHSGELLGHSQHVLVCAIPGVD